MLVKLGKNLLHLILYLFVVRRKIEQTFNEINRFVAKKRSLVICTEVIIAAKDDDKPETIYEIADLVYHVMVLMVENGISLEEIHRELASRHVIDHKVKQEKMTK